jgi:hypothetical protein
MDFSKIVVDSPEKILDVNQVIVDSLKIPLQK